MTDPDNVEAAREAALKLLDRARRTRRDLERRLGDRGYSAAAITAVLDRLAAVGLVDDVEYARAWLSGRWGRRPSGWRVLAQQLRLKGISDEDIEQGRVRLEAQQGPSDEAALAQRAVERAAPRYRGVEPRVRRQRLYALLVRRGFAPEVIAAALREVGERDA